MKDLKITQMFFKMVYDEVSDPFMLHKSGGSAQYLSLVSAPVKEKHIVFIFNTKTALAFKEFDTQDAAQHCMDRVLKKIVCTHHWLLNVEGFIEIPPEQEKSDGC